MTGQTIGHYRLLERLPLGTFGEVYKAEDTKLKRTVAFKLMPKDLSENAKSKQRFLNEAKAAGSLDHPNICAVHEVGETPEGQLYIVMGWDGGESLEEKLKRGPLPLAEALKVVTEVGRGIEAAHGKGMVHRDIRPGNILIGGEGVAKVADFGVAKLAGVERLTKTGDMVGSAGYMAPEQAMGKEADRRADIWSLGVVLYESVSGKKPFTGDTDAEVITKVLKTDPARMGEAVSGVPMQVEQVVERCLAKDPRDRYQSVRELITDLEGVGAGLSTGTLPELKVRKRRRRWVPWAAVTAAVVIVVGVAVGLWLGGPAERPSLALLPLENAGVGAGEEWIVTGTMEDLALELVRVKYVRMIAQTSSKMFKPSDDPKDVGKKLGVEYLTSGILGKSGDEVRIVMRLVRTADGREAWKKEYRTSTADLSMTVGRIVVDVVARTGVNLTWMERDAVYNKKSASPEAYALYLKAKDVMGGKAVDYRKAIQYLEEAVKIDPGFISAWDMLSYSYGNAAVWLGEPTWTQKAKEAVNKALEIDPDFYADKERERIMAAYTGEERAQKLLEMYQARSERYPNNTDIRKNITNIYRQQAKFAEALDGMLEIQKIDPVTLSTFMSLGAHYIRARYVDEAIRWTREGLVYYPEEAWLHYLLGWFLTEKGDYDTAFTELDVAYKKMPSVAEGMIGYTYAKAGRTAEAQKTLEQMMARPAPNPQLIGLTLYHLGRKEEGFQYVLDYAKRNPNWNLMNFDEAEMDPFRTEPRIRELMKARGYFDAVLSMPANGWVPIQKKKSGGLP